MNFRGRAPGFTLVEVMVALGIFLVLVSGLSAVFSTIGRNKNRVSTQFAMDAQAAILDQALGAAVNQASFIAYPLAGGNDDRLEIRDNVHPENGTAPLVPGQPLEFPVRHSLICREPTGQRLFLYRGPNPTGPINCGDQAPTGFARTTLAGGEGLRASLSFSRSAAEPSRIEVFYRIEQAPGASPSVHAKKIERTTAFRIRNAVN